MTMEQRELALAKRHRAKGEELARGTKEHTPLAPGTVVLVQNQVGPSANRWDKSGLVVADCGNSQYRVKLDGSGRITLRNRAFLKRIVPFQGREEPSSRPREVVLDRKGPSSTRLEMQGQESLMPEVPERESLMPGVPERDTGESVGEEADRMQAEMPGGPRRSLRKTKRPSRYPE